jgi:hypothetical protein
MKISESAISLMTLISTVSDSMWFIPGKFQRAVNGPATDYSMMLDLELEEDWPVEFGVAEIRSFIGSIRQFTNPELTIEHNNLYLYDKNIKQVYHSAEKLVVNYPPHYNPPNINNLLTFKLSADIFKSIINLVSFSDLTHGFFVAEKGKGIFFYFDNPEYDNKNKFNYKVSESYEGDNLSIPVHMDLVKKMKVDNYDVDVANGVVRFRNDRNFTYYIGLAADTKRAKVNVII